MDAVARQRINSLEAQLAQAREAIDMLAECACLSSDKQIQAWALRYAKLHPQIGNRVDRIVSRHWGHDAAEFEDVPREFLEASFQRR